MKYLIENGIPAYDVPDKAVNAMAALNEYACIRAVADVEGPAEDLGTAEAAARDIIRSARAQGRLSLTEIEAEKVFAAYGLPVAKTALGRWEDEAVALAAGMGCPVVLKVVSPDILHKSDAGGVKIGIRDEAGVRDAFRTIMKNARAFKADADILGVAVQKMAPAGLEVILGSVNDASFGPTMMFGLGGILVELLRHVTFRIAPVSPRQAKLMLEKVHAARIMDGLRGESPRDRDALAEVVARYSRMVVDLGDEVAESEANPTLLYEVGKGVKIVDARIVLKNK